MFSRLFKKSKSKDYDASKWQKSVPVEILQGNYDDQGWSGLRGNWRNRSAETLKRRIRELFEANSRPVTMLDVACFTGEYLGRIMEDPSMAEMLDYTGGDVTPAYVERAAERWKQLPNGKFQVANALELPFADSSFDLVFNSGMLVHMAAVEQCVQEFARVSGDTLLVETSLGPGQSEDWIEMGKSGPDFIDRVYSEEYFRRVMASVGAIESVEAVPYGTGANPEESQLSSMLIEVRITSS